MRDVVASMDAGLFWGLVAGFSAGVLVSWRFARTLERFRQSVIRARMYFASAFAFVNDARQHATAMVGVALFMTAAAVGVGFAVYLRTVGS